MAEEPITIPIDGVLDLHTFKPGEVRYLVDDYIEECRKRGISTVKIIHGKGKGHLRGLIRSILRAHPMVLSFGDSPPQEGGWGATWVVLKIDNLGEHRV